MPRILTIVAAFGIGLVASVAAAAFALGDEALELGKVGYGLRFGLSQDAERKAPDRPLVAWLGDSTIYTRAPVDPYATLVESRLESTLPIETYNRSLPGLDQYIHYLTVGNVLKLEPSALFVVVNLRLMNPDGAGRPVLQLGSMIPFEELPRASLLPWHVRAVTVPRLLLARVLDWRRLELVVHFFEGIREMFRARLYSTEPVFSPKDQGRRFGRVMRLFDTPLSRRSPSIRMLSATVEMAVRKGVPTTVILAPVPVRKLRRFKLYGPRTRQRIEFIREAVESVGGEFLDYHAELAPAGFRDRSGHYSHQGTRALAALLEPVVRAKLEGRPR